MADISLPYDQVCEIIEKVARDWTRFSNETPDTFNVSVCLAHYCRFGHKLWRALEEAHLARQGELHRASIALGLDKRKQL